MTDFAHWQIVRVPLVSVLQEEEGVAKERERIYSEEYQFDSIVIKDLQKHYKTKGNHIRNRNISSVGLVFNNSMIQFVCPPTFNCFHLFYKVNLIEH